jgi:hypothetical protein
MISTIYIDTDKERLFPMAGNTREAVTEFVKNQIDLSFVVLCSQEKIKMLKPELNDEQIEMILSRLLAIPSHRRNDIAPYEYCIDDIYQNILNQKNFVITGWSALFGCEKLTYLLNNKKVIHTFSDIIEQEFLNVYNAVTKIFSAADSFTQVPSEIQRPGA